MWKTEETKHRDWSIKFWWNLGKVQDFSGDVTGSEQSPMTGFTVRHVSIHNIKNTGI